MTIDAITADFHSAQRQCIDYVIQYRSETMALLKKKGEISGLRKLQLEEKICQAFDKYSDCVLKTSMISRELMSYKTQDAISDNDKLNLTEEEIHEQISSICDKIRTHVVYYIEKGYIPRDERKEKWKNFDKRLRGELPLNSKRIDNEMDPYKIGSWDYRKIYPEEEEVCRASENGEYDAKKNDYIRLCDTNLKEIASHIITAYQNLALSIILKTDISSTDACELFIDEAENFNQAITLCCMCSLDEVDDLGENIAQNILYLKDLKLMTTNVNLGELYNIIMPQVFADDDPNQMYS